MIINNYYLSLRIVSNVFFSQRFAVQWNRRNRWWRFQISRITHWLVSNVKTSLDHIFEKIKEQNSHFKSVRHPKQTQLLIILNYRNLAENNFQRLPTTGLKRLKFLKTFHNTNLQDRIDPENLPNIQNLVLSYAYHCCSFINSRKADVSLR